MTQAFGSSWSPTCIEVLFSANSLSAQHFVLDDGIPNFYNHYMGLGTTKLSTKIRKNGVKHSSLACAQCCKLTSDEYRQSKPSTKFWL